MQKDINVRPCRFRRIICLKGDLSHSSRECLCMSKAKVTSTCATERLYFSPHTLIVIFVEFVWIISKLILYIGLYWCPLSVTVSAFVRLYLRMYLYESISIVRPEIFVLRLTDNSNHQFVLPLPRLDGPVGSERGREGYVVHTKPSEHF